MVIGDWMFRSGEHWLLLIGIPDAGEWCSFSWQAFQVSFVQTGVEAIDGVGNGSGAGGIFSA